MKRKQKVFIISLLTLISSNKSFLFAQEIVKNDVNKSYEFNIFDGTIDSFTMRQMNENYLSLSRIVNQEVESIFEDKRFLRIKVSDWINYSWPLLINAITHEEGHRSILTANKIGSISQPFYNKHGAAYVKGVTDSTLINFRDSDKPGFVRMYTAGIESDYMMFIKEETLMSLELDTVSILYPDFLYRWMMRSSYLCTGGLFAAAEDFGGFFKWCTQFYELEEEENEFERDICGYDTLGATKALFEDNYTFKRYTQYSDLTEEGKDFIFRIAVRSYLNFLNPFLFQKPNFKIGDRFLLNASVSYSLSPFGDFIDENFYFKYITKSLGDLNFHFYARQAENYKTWFPAFGLSLINFSPLEWLSLSMSTHIWWQPTNLNFYATDSFFGGAFEFKAKFSLTRNNFSFGNSTSLKGIGLVTSILFKSKGFLPEIEYHEKHIRFSIGTEIIF